MRLTMWAGLAAAALVTSCADEPSLGEARRALARVVAGNLDTDLDCIEAALDDVGPKEIRTLAMNLDAIPGEVVEPKWVRGDEFLDAARSCAGRPTRAEVPEVLIATFAARGGDVACLRAALHGLSLDVIDNLAKHEDVIERDYPQQAITLNFSHADNIVALREC